MNNTGGSYTVPSTGGWTCSLCGQFVAYGVPHNCIPQQPFNPINPQPGWTYYYSTPLGAFVDYARIEEIVERIVRKIMEEQWRNKSTPGTGSE